MYELSDSEREQIIEAIRSGRPVPARYRNTLFDDAPETELVWPGKTREVERVVLPFQSIEHIDEPRAETVVRPSLFSIDESTGRQVGGWTNKLIWGDNLLVLSSLANGPLRQQIEQAGGLKLVYIDPPFDVGADFSIEVQMGDADVPKAPSVIEEVAYRDTWGRGQDSFASMIFQRIALIHQLLSPDGSFFIHCDWRVSGLIRLILDEIFGRDNLRNEIIWAYHGPGSPGMRQFNRKHDTIFWFSKGPKWTFNANDVRIPLAGALGGGWEGLDAEERDRRQELGKVPEDWWELAVAARLRVDGVRRTGYPTEKPNPLLERIIRAASNHGDLVADFFCGSGSLLYNAELLQRRWIGCDLGRFAIHTARKRLIGTQRQLAAENMPYRAFELLNLGSYERQYFVGIDPTLPEDQRKAASDQRREQYLSLILEAYGAQRSEQLPPFHGIKENASVFIGPLDAPVTQKDVELAVTQAKANRIARVDVLGFEFEMGIKPAMADAARDEGVSLTLRYIPHEVFDKRAIAKDQVKFFDVGYLEVATEQKARSELTVTLKDFGVFYAQEDADLAAKALRSGQVKVVVDSGHVVRISKDRGGHVSREILTKTWAEWIDYWTVDFDFESQKEIVTILEDGIEKVVWTGRYIFENQWQDYRTKRDRQLTLTSAEHRYDTPGEYKVAVKVVDVFGNDTTKVVKVKVK